MSVADDVQLVIKRLRGQADLDNGYKRARFGIIERAIEDLAVPKLSAVFYPPSEEDYPARDYLYESRFLEDAAWCDLDPEYVLDQLLKFGLLSEDGIFEEFVR